MKLVLVILAVLVGLHAAAAVVEVISPVIERSAVTGVPDRVRYVRHIQYGRVGELEASTGYQAERLKRYVNSIRTRRATVSNLAKGPVLSGSLVDGIGNPASMVTGAVGSNSDTAGGTRGTVVPGLSTGTGTSGLGNTGGTVTSAVKAGTAVIASGTKTGTGAVGGSRVNPAGGAGGTGLNNAGIAGGSAVTTVMKAAGPISGTAMNVAGSSGSTGKAGGVPDAAALTGMVKSASSTATSLTKSGGSTGMVPNLGTLGGKAGSDSNTKTGQTGTASPIKVTLKPGDRRRRSQIHYLPASAINALPPARAPVFEGRTRRSPISPHMRRN